MVLLPPESTAPPNPSAFAFWDMSILEIRTCVLAPVLTAVELPVIRLESIFTNVALVLCDALIPFVFSVKVLPRMLPLLPF